MRLAVTGHRDLPAETARLVDDAVRTELREHLAAELVGISCLAEGAEAIFAQAVLDAGGALEVVVPAAEYHESLPEEHRPTYDGLLAEAADVELLEYVEPTTQARSDAAAAALNRADALLAVWDGQPADADRITDVIELARERNIPVAVVWPEGAARG